NTGVGAMTMREHTDFTPTKAMMGEFIKEGEAHSLAEPDGERELRYIVGLGQTELFLKGNEQMRASVDALFTSIVLDSWLYFEALCGDLWVTAVDNGGAGIFLPGIENTVWGVRKKKIVAAEDSRI